MNDHVLTDYVENDHRRLFESVCKNATDAIFVMDENQHCFYMNPAAERLTGFRMDEVRGRALHDIIHHTKPDGSPYPLEECPIDRAFPEHMRMRGEELFIHKDGHFLPVAYTASPIYDQRSIVGTILEVRDITERKRTERLLRESEEFSRRILESSQDCIKVLDLDARLVSINQCGARALQLSDPQEAVGADYLSFWSDADREAACVAIREARAGRVGRFTASYITPSGKVTWWDEVITLIKGGEGKAERLLVTSRDISERTEMEQALRKSEERFKKVFENSHDAIFILDPERNAIVDVNPAGVVMFGYESRDEVLSTPLSEFHPDDLSKFLDFVRGVFVEGSGWTDEFACRTKSGGTVVSEISASSLDLDGRNLLLAQVRDVGERKRAEQALRESEARLRAAYENVQVGICEVDLRGRFLRVNGTFCRITGYERDELIGMCFADITHPDDISENFEALSRMKTREAETVNADKRYIRKDGTIAWVNLSSVLVLGEDDRPDFALTAIQDITERKRAEQHQNLLLDELNHRVKNMLATVLSIAAQSFRGDSLTAEMRSAFQARLFALSEAHGLLTRKNWENVGICDLAMKALEPFRSLDGTRERLRIEGENIPLKPKVALALGMAFHELAANAAKYGALSNNDGSVELSWRLLPATKQLGLLWREKGGPAVEPPRQKGFGTRLISQGLAHELDADVCLDYDPSGVICTIKMPAPGAPEKVER